MIATARDKDSFPSIVNTGFALDLAASTASIAALVDGMQTIDLIIHINAAYNS
jgi:hypothetical protein